MPRNFTVREVHQIFSQYGNIQRVIKKSGKDLTVLKKLRLAEFGALYLQIGVEI